MQEEILIKLYQYCAYQDRCTQEVLDKMKELEVEIDEYDNYLAHLEDERFLDDARFVTSYVRGKFYHKSWGRQKIRHELKRRNVPLSIIEAGLREEIPEEDYLEKAYQLAIKKWDQTSDGDRFARREKVARYMVQKGYEFAAFQESLDELLNQG